MDTKHINDTSDPSAIEARALTTQLELRDEVPRPKGPALLRLVEDQVSIADNDFGLEGPVATATDAATVKNRPARVGFVIHRLGGRIVPWYRRQR